MWERTVDGRVLSFQLDGINNQNFIMRDRETGSWWQQVSGEAIRGPLKGTKLKRVFHDELTFKAWRSEWPGGRVLVPSATDTAWKRYAQGWEEQTGKYPVKIHGALDPQLAPRAIVMGIEVGEVSKAYPLDRILAQAPIHDRVGGLPIVLLVGEDGKSVRAFEARLDTVALELVRTVGEALGQVTDVGSGSRGNFRGEAVSGPLLGRR
ncbi:MAG: DUF3179 domain-containing protein, partial [Gemmatimonadales bacterium]|nr:DUF3179 domain-containing protein [Gemmatimonadales bacterium]